MSFLAPRLTRTARIARVPRLARTYASTSELKPNLSYTSVTHPDSSTPESTQNLIKSHTSYLLNTYARPPILITHGKGSTLTDSSGREYLDFTAGIAVTALGHADEGINQVIADQSGKISHASNIYWNEHAGELAKLIVEETKKAGGLGLGPSTGGKEQEQGMGKSAKVFFTNSGTEANEGALKFVRLFGKQVGSGGEKTSKTGIVCFSNAFHGRSMGALSCTPNPKYQAPFAPLIPGVRVGEYNDMSEDKMRALVDENVCGVIVEPIQGEGGVGTAKVEWLQMLGKRCREVGAVLIYDEIQCGLFRSGSMWAHSTYPADAQPDIVTMAKPLANGFPIGAILVRDSVAETISVGAHGTTFGGQPLATRIGLHVIQRLSSPEFTAHLKDVSAHLDSLLKRLPALFPELIKSELRGKGLIRGIGFKDATAPAELVKLARERGVLLLTAGSDAVRCVPPLIITKEQCEQAVGVMESCLSIIQENRAGKA